MGLPGEQDLEMPRGGRFIHDVYDPFGGYRAATNQKLAKTEACWVDVDKSSGLYRFVARMGPETGLTWIVVVDPSKGFMPIAHAWCLPPAETHWNNARNAPVPVGEGIMLDAKDPAQRLLKLEGSSVLWMSRNTEAKQYGDVWLPTRIQTDLSEYSRTFAVTDVQLNTAIPDDTFDLRFPDNTRVEDRIAKLWYVVGEADGDAPGRRMGLNELLTKSDLPSKPATDAELEKVNTQAQAMLGKTGIERTGGYAWLITAVIAAAIVTGGLTIVFLRARKKA